MIPFASQRKDAEDVLSSIRRMVSEEAKAKIADAAPRLDLTAADMIAPDPLVLTEDQAIERLAQEPVIHPDPIADAIGAGRNSGATPPANEHMPEMSEDTAPDEDAATDEDMAPGEDTAQYTGPQAPEQTAEIHDIAAEAPQDDVVVSAKFDIPPSDIAPMPDIQPDIQAVPESASAPEADQAEDDTPVPTLEQETDASAETDVAPDPAPNTASNIVSNAEAVPLPAFAAKTPDPANADAPAPQTPLELVQNDLPPKRVRNLLSEEIDGDDAPYLDELQLRKIIAEMIREEFEGEMGERITRNVRKLIRREIARALSMKS